MSLKQILLWKTFTLATLSSRSRLASYDRIDVRGGWLQLAFALDLRSLIREVSLSDFKHGSRLSGQKGFGRFCHL